jgi:hypothetical protein
MNHTMLWSYWNFPNFSLHQFPGWLQDPVGDPSTEYEQDITTIYICNKYIYISLTNSLFQKLELKMPYITFTNLYILYG